jgi:hypothetical protein
MHFYNELSFFLKINNRGHLTFRSGFLDFTPSPFPLTTPIPIPIMIAPFWNDINIVDGGGLFFRQSTDAALLDLVGSDVSAAFDMNFSPTLLFIVTWDSVPNTGASPLVSRILFTRYGLGFFTSV